MQWFEDMVPGRVDRFGHHLVTREEALAFARAYDPQAFHVDDAAAAANPLFGRLAASGWYTAAVGMRMVVDYWHENGGRALLAGAGVDKLRWLAPVYPGDTLHCLTEVTEVRPSRNKPDRGLVTTKLTVLNQHDVIVMSHESVGVLKRRSTGE